MTDEQIIKAVEVCREPDTCKDCPYHKLYTARCIIMLMKDVFDLINRQKAEIERLKKKNEKYINRIEKDIVLPKIFGEQAKSEVIKEFAERLKGNLRLDDDCEYNCRNCCYECKEFVPQIDNLVKEMTEGQE